MPEWLIIFLPFLGLFTGANAVVCWAEDDFGWFWPISLSRWIKREAINMRWRRYSVRPLYELDYFDSSTKQWLRLTDIRNYQRFFISSTSLEKALNAAKKSTVLKEKPYLELRPVVIREGVLKSSIRKRQTEQLTTERQQYRETYISWLESELKKNENS